MSAITLTHIDIPTTVESGVKYHMPNCQINMTTLINSMLSEFPSSPWHKNGTNVLLVGISKSKYGIV